jgi:DNA polymerase-3 subunit delta
MVKKPANPVLADGSKPVGGSGVYLLVGKEDFLKDEFLFGLRVSLFPAVSDASLNYQEFHAKSSPLSEPFDFIRTVSFLGGRRLAVLRGIDVLVAEDKSRLLSFVEKFSGEGVLALISDEGSVKKDNFLKSLSGFCQVVNCYPPFEKDWPGWVQARAKKRNVVFESNALPVLFERVGREMAALSQAIETLSVFIHPRQKISPEDVESLLGRSAQADAFELVDLILRRNAKLGLERLNRLLDEGSRGYEIIPALAGQWDRLSKAKTLLRARRSAQDIAGALKIHPFYLEKTLNQAESISEERIRLGMARILECDEHVKSSALSDRFLMEKLVLELCA